MADIVTREAIGKTQRKPKLCPCGTEMCRPGQGNGPACHANEQRIYRARQRDTIMKARQIIREKKAGDMASFHVAHVFISPEPR